MTPATMTPSRQIRASFDESTITVYQAYSASIADPAVAAQRLTASPNFKTGRMTWIKPSWAWMLYRAGYSYKDPGQERILALKMRHDDFVGLLRRGVLSSHATPRRSLATATPAAAHATTDVRIQWDPERTVRLERLPYRSIQIGIPASLSAHWAEECIVGIEDVTAKARELKLLLDDQPDVDDQHLFARGLIPTELPYDVPADVRQALGMDIDASHASPGEQPAMEEKNS
ncbi:ATP-dependent RNA helicase DHX8 [Plectosphaerella cucumerina]|uniref:ATP-dependent RNA helicase DHX8 n=1 Tax=Plectosphaerella cucumerina TaxID=40658 RepID=A0A8K0TD16_9PEZI|nr:ATP-dependent RNA helicase DHX8 [Plectosphaerella cucumerina]